MHIYNASRIEHHLAQFFGCKVGDRHHFFDADVFRRGTPKDLADVLSRTADRIEQRMGAIDFSDSDEQSGGAKARLNGTVSVLRKLAERVAERTTDEREDYHWEVFGELLGTVDVLFSRLGA